MLKNIKFRKFFRSILAFLSTCFLVLLLWIFVDCFTEKRNATNEIINYKIKDSIKYDVNLIDNQFYTSSEANKDNRYVTALMDTLQIYFDYELVGNKYFSSNYGYNVNLELLSSYDGESIWEYKEEVLPRVDLSLLDSMKVKISDTVIIDIRSVYEKAMAFKELTGYDVKLKVNVNIDNTLKVKDNENDIKDEQMLSLNIPITKKVVSITTSNNKDLDRKVVSHYEVDEEFNTFLFIFSGILILAILPVTFMSYVSLFNLINLDDYNRKLSTLKKKYSKFIKTVSKRPDFEGKEVIEVITCREVVRVAIEKDLPINLYEDDKNKESWFYVVNQKTVYLYILELSFNNIDMSDREIKLKSKEKGNDKKS